VRRDAAPSDKLSRSFLAAIRLIAMICYQRQVSAVARSDAVRDKNEAKTLAAIVGEIAAPIRLKDGKVRIANLEIDRSPIVTLQAS